MRLSRFSSLLLAGLLLGPSAGAVAAQSEAPVSAVLASADQAWSAHNYDLALEMYRAVLRRDSTATRALFRVATVLSWHNDFAESAALFRAYLRLAPGDDDARLGLARTLAWSGKHTQAMAICDSVLAVNPAQREAAILSARILVWSGDRARAATRYQEWLSRNPNDAEARAELDRLTLPLAASLEPVISSTDDSDENRSTTYSLDAGVAAPWNARLNADGYYRVADLGTLHGTAAAIRATSSYAPRDEAWTLRGEIGGVQLDATDAPAAPHIRRIEPVAVVRLFGRLGSRLSLGGGAARTPFDETAALIRSGIALTTIDGDGDYSLGRLGIAASGGWTRLSGGSGPNSRANSSGTVTWAARPFVSIAAGVHACSYAHAALDGYFAPRRYLLAELSTRLHFGGELGWAMEAELGGGDQSITSFDGTTVGRFAQRMSAALTYRVAPGMEWGVKAGYATAASPTTSSAADYHAYSLSLRGRVRL